MLLLSQRASVAGSERYFAEKFQEHDLADNVSYNRAQPGARPRIEINHQSRIGKTKAARLRYSRLSATRSNLATRN